MQKRISLLTSVSHTCIACRVYAHVCLSVCTNFEITKLSPEKEKFSVPRAARDPKILKDRNLENEDIFELIKNPPEVGAV